MNPDKLVTVYTTTEPLKADIIRDALDDNGIPAFLENQSLIGDPFTLKSAEVRILVQPADVDRAVEFIKQREAQHAADEEE
jgi:hypothetical protein